MMELDSEAKEAGITVMNEIGLDPGIDHLSAVLTIDEVHKAGGKVLSFLSYCGGLPAPEASDNPLGYKFSWSSRGVLLALRNAAKWTAVVLLLTPPLNDATVAIMRASLRVFAYAALRTSAYSIAVPALK